MQLNYVYRKYDNYYVGYLIDFPEYGTQGETIEELEEMLKSLHADLMIFDDIHSSIPYKSGVLELA